MMSKSLSKNEYQSLKTQIGQLLRQGREQAGRSVNTILVQTYWHIGRYIVEFEQGGKEKSEYCSELLDRLSRDLTLEFGKGFSQNLERTFLDAVENPNTKQIIVIGWSLPPTDRDHFCRPLEE